MRLCHGKTDYGYWLALLISSLGAQVQQQPRNTFVPLATAVRACQGTTTTAPAKTAQRTPGAGPLNRISLTKSSSHARLSEYVNQYF